MKDERASPGHRKDKLLYLGLLRQMTNELSQKAFEQWERYTPLRKIGS